MPALGDIFLRTYRHRFVIRLGQGDWRAINLPAVAWAHLEPLLPYETTPRDWQGDLPPTGSLLELRPSNVEILAVRTRGNRSQIVVNETHGKDTRAFIRLGETAREVALRPFGVASLEF